MASSKELKALIVLAGKVDPSLKTAMLKATGEFNKVTDSAKKAGLTMGDIFKGSMLGNLAADAIRNAAYSLKQFAGESIKLASDLKEVQNVVDVTFGNSAKEINSWAKTALKNYGLAELQAKQFAGTMGAMLQSSGVSQKDMVLMSQSLAGLAGDFASFYNLSHEEAWQKIQSGMAGEIEPLRALGIDMSVASLEAYALAKGIKVAYKDMDSGTKSLLKYQYLMEKSGNAQGDFARTQGEYANQRRLFDASLRQSAALIASKALPYLTKLFNKANEFIANTDWNAVANTVGAAFNDLGDAIQWAKDNSDWLVPAISGVVGAMGALKIINTVTALYKAWTATTFLQTWAQYGLNTALTANPIGIVIVGIGGLIALGVALYKNWDKVIAKAKEMWKAFNEYIAPVKEFFGYEEKKAVSVGKTPKKKYATGGIATRASIFGEAGPEMAIPLKRTPRSLSLLNQTAQILGAGGGNQNSISVTVYAQSSQPNDIAAEVVRVIEGYFEGKGRVSFG